MSALLFTRRTFLKTAGLSVAGLPALLQACAAPAGNAKSYFIYVGTYAKPQEESIFGYRLNPVTGELTRIMAVKGGENPSFLTLDAKRKYLYAANETAEYNGAKSGAVSAFAVDKRTGHLKLLNQQASAGPAPCYVSLDRTGQVVLAANYSGGNIVALPRRANGQLGPVVGNEQHQGSSVNQSRQSGPHAHCVIPDPKNNFIFAVDLGLDQVLAYRLNSKTAQLTRAAQPAFQAKAGAGPRHLTFHPNGRYAYLINELNSTMTALLYNPSNGIFTELQTLSTLPAAYTGESYCADVHVSPDGKFLYGSNRGHNSLVVYQIDDSLGRLTLVQHVPTQGDWPRNFALEPSGNILVVANQKSNDIFSYRINRVTGELTPTGFSAQVPAPVCLRVVPDFGG